MAINDPRDIPGLVCWYSAEAETGYADGAQIPQWTDRSGNGNHAAGLQSTAAQYPFWESTDGAAGGPAIRFVRGGSSSRGGVFQLPNLSALTEGEAFSTLKVDAATSGTHWDIGVRGTAAAPTWPATGNVVELFGLNQATYSFAPGVDLTSWRRYNVWAKTNDFAARIDEVTRGTLSTGTVAFGTGPLIGRYEAVTAATHTGHMGCFVLFNRKLTTSERADMDAWLAANPSGGVPASNIDDPYGVPGLRWWVSAKHAALTNAEGAQVSTWTDLGPLAAHGTGVAGTGGAKPLMRLTGGRSGGATIEFQSGDSNKVGGYFTIPASVFTGLTSATIVVEIKSDQGHTTQWKMGLPAASAAHYPYGTSVYEDFCANDRNQFTPSLAVNVWRRYRVKAAQFQHQSFIDQVAQAGSSALTFQIPTAPKLGGGDAYNLAGKISAVVIYDHILTSGEAADIDHWLIANPDGGLPAPVLPTAPTSLGETHDQDSIDFTWAAPSGGDPATGYKVRIDSGSWIDVGLVLTHTFSGLSPSTTYTMDVRAYNAAGDGPLASLNATTDAPPTPNVPTSLGETHDQDSINFTWAAPSGGAAPTGYEARISGGGPVDVGNAFAHEFTSLAAATPYDLEVRAYNGAGFSAWALLQATTDPAPPPPPPPPGQFPDVPKPKPVQRPMRRGWRYFATRLNGDGTETLLNIDLPLENVTIEDILSGDGAISGTISPVYSNLIASDGEPLFQEWSTALYAEQNGSIRAGAILTNSEFDGPDWSLEATGFTSYLRDLPYIGPGYKGIHVDPIDVVRTIWAHAQSKRGGNLGMVLDTTTTGGKVDIGTELKQVAFDSVSGPISFESGPYKLNEYSSHDLAQNIDDLANETPFDYHERHYWSGDQIIHRLDIGYPRIGRRREDLRFLYGVNIFDPVALNRDGSGYASGTLVLGAGDGASAIRAVSEPPVRPGNRLRRIAVVVDDTIKSKSRATKRATAENQWRARLNDVDSVVVQDHPNARLGAAQVGDEIRLEGQGDWIGIDMWVRILAVSYQPANGNVAEYSIVRTDRLMS